MDEKVRNTSISSTTTSPKLLIISGAALVHSVTLPDLDDTRGLSATLGDSRTLADTLGDFR